MILVTGRLISEVVLQQSALNANDTTCAEHVAAVEALPFVREVRRVDEGLSVKLESPEANNPHLVRALVAAGADIQFIQEVEKHTYMHIMLHHAIRIDAQPGDAL